MFCGPSRFSDLWRLRRADCDLRGVQLRGGWLKMTSMITLGRRVAALLLLAALLPRAAPAQESIRDASLGGRVTDPSGAVVVGAEVTARQAETNLTATTETDGSGRFRFAYLRIGPYEVTVRKAGFADVS